MHLVDTPSSCHSRATVAACCRRVIGGGATLLQQVATLLQQVAIELPLSYHSRTRVAEGWHHLEKTAPAETKLAATSCDRPFFGRSQLVIAGRSPVGPGLNNASD